MKKIVNEQLAVSSSNPLRVRTYDYRRFTYPWHFHSQYELLYVSCGQGTCLVGDSLIEYHEGDLLFFGSGLPHCMQNEPDEQLAPEFRVKGIIIQLEKDFMQYSFSHYVQFETIRNLLEKTSRGIRFSLNGKPEITDCLQQITQTNGVEQIIQILRLFQSLATLPFKQYAASPNYNPDPSELGDPKMEKIISYLNKRYTRPVSLSEIALHAAMNESAFCRYFKQSTGKTFKQYLTDMRIGYACRLLASGRLNISQICLECGFESISHFNRCFKRIMEVTPTEYKETMR